MAERVHAPRIAAVESQRGADTKGVSNNSYNDTAMTIKD
jgi:hypothetical protein